jgi:hypothetical protein
MTVTFVKKILADGRPCAKCADVEARLTTGGHWPAIDRVLIADERDPASDGMRLATRLGVDRAPFFVVENAQETIVYTVFLKFMRDYLRSANANEAAEAVLRSHPELDHL